jgi:hypothetical protein
MTNEQAESLCEALNRLLTTVDKMLDLEFRLCWHFLVVAAAEWRALNDAREWIKHHLVKSQEGQNVRALKHVAEHAGREHLTHRAFVKALREAGFTIEGDTVFARESIS